MMRTCEKVRLITIWWFKNLLWKFCNVEIKNKNMEKDVTMVYKYTLSVFKEDEDDPRVLARSFMMYKIGQYQFYLFMCSNLIISIFYSSTHLWILSSRVRVWVDHLSSAWGQLRSLCLRWPATSDKAIGAGFFPPIIYICKQTTTNEVIHLLQANQRWPSHRLDSNSSTD